MGDDTSSKQPVSDLKGAMSTESGGHPDMPTSPELVDSMQTEELAIKKLLTRTAVCLIWVFALSAIAFMILDGAQIDEIFELSDWILGVYIVAALSPTSAYLIRRTIALGMGV